MSKTAQTELRRQFLIEGLPEPLSRSSAHLQLFDNYIESTRLRLRSIRDPYKKTWSRILQQRFTTEDHGLRVTRLAEIYLDEAEHAVFERFEGREIRKNRYFHEFDRRIVTFDVYLGTLWGMTTASVDFPTREEMADHIPLPFEIFEVTDDPFFRGENLVGKTFEDVRREVERVGPTLDVVEPPDE